MVERALRNGRVVTLDNIAATHFHSQATFRRLVLHYWNNHGVQLQAMIAEELLVIEDGEWLGRMATHVSVDHLRAEAESRFNEEYAALARTHPGLDAAFRARGSRVA